MEALISEVDSISLHGDLLSDQIIPTEKMNHGLIIEREFQRGAPVPKEFHHQITKGVITLQCWSSMANARL